MFLIKRFFNPKIPQIIYEFLVLSIRISFAMVFATFKAIIPFSGKNLLGETVLITGAGHGLGRELAIQLASMGCIVVCWDIDTSGNQGTMSAAMKLGGEVYGFAVDVGNRFEVRETMKMMRKMGLPDVTLLINNAAVLHHSPFITQDEDCVKKTFSVNVLSNFWTIQAFLPTMLQNGNGHVVSVSSMCGICGIADKVAYCSSKFAVRGMMEALHEELRLYHPQSGVKFTTIYPFYIDTGLARNPKYRFPYIFGVVSPEYAAKEVIKAIRMNYTEYSIPRCLFTLNAINRLLPEAGMRMVLDYLADVNSKRKEGLICSR